MSNELYNTYMSRTKRAMWTASLWGFIEGTCVSALLWWNLDAIQAAGARRIGGQILYGPLLSSAMAVIMVFNVRMLFAPWAVVDVACKRPRFRSVGMRSRVETWGMAILALTVVLLYGVGHLWDLGRLL